LTAAGLLVALQAAGLAGIAVVVIVEVLVATAEDVTRALVTALLAAVAAGGLGLAARGLWWRRRWARAPALVTNVLVLPVAYDMVRGERWYVGAPLALWALVVIGLLLAPATHAALEE
jgi:uncharacterized membrane protein (DUF2068 family)